MNANNPRDLDFMNAALSLARRGLGNTFPNPAVGCIIVKDGLVVGRGWTQPGGRPHAETVALAEAGNLSRGATAYVTLEPCAHTGKTPPCAGALVNAGIARVVVAITDPDDRVAGQGLEILRRAGVKVTENVSKIEAWHLNKGFFLSQTQNRPLFTLKLATDAHGFIPGPDAKGADKWITSPQARARGQLLRANQDAVLFGIGTVLADNPTYTCRLPGMILQSPNRILLDSDYRLDTHSNLLKSLDISPLWIVGCDLKSSESKWPQGSESKWRQDNVEIINLPGPRPDLITLSAELVKRGITRVLIETGPTLVNAFLAAGLVDEVAWFRAARTLGPGCVAGFDKKSLEKLDLQRQAVLQAGPDQLELYRREA